MPHEPAGRPQTPGEARDGVGGPLMDSAAVCALLGVQRNALARYRAAGLPFVVLAPGVYRYRRADLDAWLAARTVTGHGGGTGDEEVRPRESLEDGATPARGTLTPPVPRSQRPPSAPPAPHPASPDVLRSPVTGWTAPRCTCPCGCRWTVKAGGRCPQCARGSHRRPA